MQELYRDPHPHQVNEAHNPLGSNRCTSNSQCDGFRTCSIYRWCQGWAGVNGVDYNVAPAKTTYGTTHVENYQAEGTTNFRNQANRGDTTVDNLSGLRGSVQNFGLVILI